MTDPGTVAEKLEETEGSKSTQLRLAPKHPEKKDATARKPARRATDFPSNSTAIRAKNRPGDAVILERTGKSWRNWFALLNAAGPDREHRKKIIATNTEAHFWWRNVVLIAYELDRAACAGSTSGHRPVGSVPPER